MSEILGKRASRPHLPSSQQTLPQSAGTLAPRETIDSARRAIARRFRQAGIDTPDLDARILAGHALGLDLTGLVRAGDRRLEDDELALLETFAVRRLGREPVARITGAKEFWGLHLRVTPDVLVPRPETETVVEQALAAVDCTGSRARHLHIADLGCGSGAIMIALLTELPNATAIGTDRDPAALALARENARRAGVSPRAAFAACDFAAALAPGCDLIVTNPPYICSGEIAALEPDVRAFDPRLALDGGPDGLAAYRVIAKQASGVLKRGAHLIAEIGKGQGDAVAALFTVAGLGDIRIVPDLAGVERAVAARNL
jgi:release factor glutamine methyltransferase